MTSTRRILVALSGGVDSAVAAHRLVERGFAVECLHMSNWDDDDGYCDSASDLQDARRVCDRLGLTLHRVSFAREYRELVFSGFLNEIRAGRTPNPDVLCNREIKFGLLTRYARRLGASGLATGHFARIGESEGHPILLRGLDRQKDQSYFLNAVGTSQLASVSFPVGELTKTEVRRLAGKAGLEVASKRDSTGICFIGERPYAEFLSRFIEPLPGPIVTDSGTIVGEHRGLHLYTLGQRKGLGVGGIDSADDAPWYVAAKHSGRNELVVVQGHDHPALFSDWLETAEPNWIGSVPAAWARSGSLRCSVKTRYRQADQHGRLVALGDGRCGVAFERPQRAAAPGQFAVFYLGERCLGGARIETTATRGLADRAAAEAV